MPSLVESNDVSANFKNMLKIIETKNVCAKIKTVPRVYMSGNKKVTVSFANESEILKDQCPNEKKEKSMEQNPKVVTTRKGRVI